MAILSIDDVKVEYFQSGTGPDLLLLPSLLTELSVFERVLPGLRKTHRVTCLNFPGFGASDAVKLDSVAEYADHVASTMEGLNLKPDTDVFGNGFGAFVALSLAISHGSRFRKLIVADVVATFPEAAKMPFRIMAGKVRAGGMNAILDTAIGRMFPVEFQTANSAVIEDRRAKLGTTDPECFARACLALASVDLRPQLGTVRNRTLVLCGALDQTTPPPLAKEVAEAIPGASYEEIPGSGHCPMLEQADRLVAAIEAFSHKR